MELIQKKVFHTLDYYRQFPSDIPDKSGIYFWVYWPFKERDTDNSNWDKFESHLKMFSSVDFNIPETSNTGYKFNVTVVERGLSGKGLLGLSDHKLSVLISHLSKGVKEREHFINYLRILAFNRPFYIGKANSLRARLIQHFEQRNSDIIDNLNSLGVSSKDILIGFEILTNTDEIPINLIYEEIAQRIIKPGLTKRPG